MSKPRYSRRFPGRPKRLACLSLPAIFLCVQVPLQAAGACVVAKKMGNSLALEWVAGPELTVEQAVEEGKRRLEEQGYGQDRYEDLFPQANSAQQHAHLVIVRSQYPNARGRPRTSYGCGFSAENAAEAEWAALRDLQSYSWGWMPDKGYEVIEKVQY